MASSLVDTPSKPLCSGKVPGHLSSKLSTQRLAGEKEPKGARTVGSAANQQIQDKLRVAMRVKPVLHEHQRNRHGNAKHSRIKVAFPQELPERNTKLSTEVSWQEKDRRAQQWNCCTDGIADDAVWPYQHNAQDQIGYAFDKNDDRQRLMPAHSKQNPV